MSTTTEIPPDAAAARTPRRFDANLMALCIVVLAALPVPYLLSTPQREIAVRILLFALLSVGWNVMGGFAGQFSFGHAAFFGIGAYTSAFLLVNFGLSPWIGMALGAILAAGFAGLTGYLSFRYKLTGAYFALATLAFAEMLRNIVSHAPVVNRAAGFRVPLERDESWWMLQFAPGSVNYYFAILGLFAASMAAVILLMRSRTGYFIVAVRENEDAAASLGIDATRYKMIAVAVSGAITAVGGSFFFQFLFFIDPELAFGAAISVQILLPAIIGGTGTIWGPPIGAFILVLLGESTTNFARNPPAFLGFIEGRSGVELMIFGAVLIVIIIYLPRGVFGSLKQRYDRGALRRATAGGNP